MNKLMRFTIVLSIFISVAEVFAITTPQSYCQSLPASSCEILNFDNLTNTWSGAPVNLLSIKYCRDRNFKVTLLRYWQWGLNASTMATFQDPMTGSTTSTVLDTPSACANTWSNGVRLLP